MFTMEKLLLEHKFGSFLLFSCEDVGQRVNCHLLSATNLGRYDYGAKRLAIRVNFPDSSNMVELFHFDTKQRFQQCSFTTNCLNTVWNQQQWYA